MGLISYVRGTPLQASPEFKGIKTIEKLKGNPGAVPLQASPEFKGINTTR